MVRLRRLKDVNRLALLGLQTCNFIANFLRSATGITGVHIVRLFTFSVCCLFVVFVASVFIVAYAV
jgi:hypothetical protein